jgi:hypothetical protein
MELTILGNVALQQAVLEGYAIDIGNNTINTGQNIKKWLQDSNYNNVLPFTTETNKKLFLDKCVKLIDNSFKIVEKITLLPTLLLDTMVDLYETGSLSEMNLVDYSSKTKNDSIDKILEFILNIITTDGCCQIASGYSSDKGGHSIGVYIKSIVVDKIQKFEVHILNTGDGMQYHARRESSKYGTIISEVDAVIKKTVSKDILYEFILSISIPDHADDMKKTGSDFYLTAVSILFRDDQKSLINDSGIIINELEPKKRLYIHEQVTGTCAFRSILYTILFIYTSEFNETIGDFYDWFDYVRVCEINKTLKEIYDNKDKIIVNNGINHYETLVKILIRQYNKFNTIIKNEVINKIIREQNDIFDRYLVMFKAHEYDVPVSFNIDTTKIASSDENINYKYEIKVNDITKRETDFNIKIEYEKIITALSDIYSKKNSLVENMNIITINLDKISENKNNMNKINKIMMMNIRHKLESFIKYLFNQRLEKDGFFTSFYNINTYTSTSFVARSNDLLIKNPDLLNVLYNMISSISGLQQSYNTFTEHMDGVDRTNLNQWYSITLLYIIFKLMDMNNLLPSTSKIMPEDEYRYYTNSLIHVHYTEYDFLKKIMDESSKYLNYFLMRNRLVYFYRLTVPDDLYMNIATLYDIYNIDEKALLDIYSELEPIYDFDSHLFKKPKVPTTIFIKLFIFTIYQLVDLNKKENTLSGNMKKLQTMYESKPFQLCFQIYNAIVSSCKFLNAEIALNETSLITKSSPFKTVIKINKYAQTTKKANAFTIPSIEHKMAPNQYVISHNIMYRFNFDHRPEHTIYRPPSSYSSDIFPYLLNINNVNIYDRHTLLYFNTCNFINYLPQSLYKEYKDENMTKEFSSISIEVSTNNLLSTQFLKPAYFNNFLIILSKNIHLLEEYILLKACYNFIEIYEMYIYHDKNIITKDNIEYIDIIRTHIKKKYSNPKLMTLTDEEHIVEPFMKLSLYILFTLHFDKAYVKEELIFDIYKVISLYANITNDTLYIKGKLRNNSSFSKGYDNSVYLIINRIINKLYKLFYKFELIDEVEKLLKPINYLASERVDKDTIEYIIQQNYNMDNYEIKDGNLTANDITIVSTSDEVIEYKQLPISTMANLVITYPDLDISITYGTSYTHTYKCDFLKNENAYKNKYIYLRKDVILDKYIVINPRYYLSQGYLIENWIFIYERYDKYNIIGIPRKDTSLKYNKHYLMIDLDDESFSLYKTKYPIDDTMQGYKTARLSRYSKSYIYISPDKLEGTLLYDIFMRLSIIENPHNILIWKSAETQKSKDVWENNEIYTIQLCSYEMEIYWDNKKKKLFLDENNEIIYDSKSKITFQYNRWVNGIDNCFLVMNKDRTFKILLFNKRNFITSKFGLWSAIDDGKYKVIIDMLSYKFWTIPIHNSNLYIQPDNYEPIFYYILYGLISNNLCVSSVYNSLDSIMNSASFINILTELEENVKNPSNTTKTQVNKSLSKDEVYSRYKMSESTVVEPKSNNELLTSYTGIKDIKNIINKYSIVPILTLLFSYYDASPFGIFVVSKILLINNTLPKLASKLRSLINNIVGTVPSVEITKLIETINEIFGDTEDKHMEEKFSLIEKTILRNYGEFTEYEENYKTLIIKRPLVQECLTVNKISYIDILQKINNNFVNKYITSLGSWKVNPTTKITVSNYKSYMYTYTDAILRYAITNKQILTDSEDIIKYKSKRINPFALINFLSKGELNGKTHIDMTKFLDDLITKYTEHKSKPNIICSDFSPPLFKLYESIIQRISDKHIPNISKIYTELISPERYNKEIISIKKSRELKKIIGSIGKHDLDTSLAMFEKDYNAANQYVYNDNIFKIIDILYSFIDEFTTKIKSIYISIHNKFKFSGNTQWFHILSNELDDQTLSLILLSVEINKLTSILPTLFDLINTKESDLTLLTEKIINLRPTYLTSKDNNYLQLVFEFIFGYNVLNNQKAISDSIYNNINSNSAKIYQMLMGAGKSSVIAPYTSLRLLVSKDVKNIINCMPESLLNQFEYNINKLFHSIPYIKINRVNITRNDRKQYDILERKNKSIILMSDKTLKTIKLNNYDTVPTKYIFDKKSTCVLFDEIDEIADPIKSELNFPYGDANELDYMSIRFSFMYDLLNEIIYGDSMEEFRNNLLLNNKAFNLPYFHFSNSADILDIYKKLTGEDALSKLLSASITKYFGEIAAKINIINFIKTKTVTESITNDSLIKYLGIIHHIIFYVLPNVLVAIHRKHFGLVDPIDNLNTKNKHNFIAVPYTAVDTPGVGSEFSDPDLTLAYTIISYIDKRSHKIREIDIELYFEYLYESFIGDIIPDATQKRSHIEYNKMIKDIPGDVPILLTRPSISSLNQDQINKIKERDILYPYLLQVVIPKYKVNKYQLNCSFVDVMVSNYISKRSGFSGTPNINYVDTELNTELSVPLNKIVLRQEDDGAVVSALLGLSSVDPIVIYRILNICNVIECLGDIFVEKGYTCLIDTGAYYVGYKAIYIATEIMKRIIAAKKHQECVVFIDTDHKKKALLKNWTIIPFNELNVPLSNRCVFFDQPHIVGQDITMADNAKALITVNYFNRWRDISQGAFRMRKLNKGQSIDFVMNSFVTKIIFGKELICTMPETSRLYDCVIVENKHHILFIIWLKDQDIKQFVEQSSLFSIQYERYLYRTYTELTGSDKLTYVSPDTKYDYLKKSIYAQYAIKPLLDTIDNINKSIFDIYIDECEFVSKIIRSV